MADDSNSVKIEHNEQLHRFETKLGDSVAVAAYQRRNGALVFTHTQVPKALEGHGIGSKLAQAGLEYARAQGLQVVPMCPFIASYIQRHQEYADMVPEEHQFRVQKDAAAT